MWGVNWPTVQMMLADMPWYDYEGKKESINDVMTLDDMQDKSDLEKFIEKVNKTHG